MSLLSLYTEALKVMTRDAKGSRNRSSSRKSKAQPNGLSVSVLLSCWDTHINSRVLLVQVICPFRLDSHPVPWPKSPWPSLSRARRKLPWQQPTKFTFDPSHFYSFRDQEVAREAIPLLAQTHSHTSKDLFEGREIDSGMVVIMT